MHEHEKYILDERGKLRRKIEQQTINESEAGQLIIHCILYSREELDQIIDGLIPLNLNTNKIFKELDSSLITFEDNAQFMLTFKIFSNLCKSDNSVFPFDILFSDWNNSGAQINFINFILDLKIDLTLSSNLTPLVYVSNGSVSSTSVNTSNQDNLFFAKHSYLNCLELFKCITNKNVIFRIKNECYEMCLMGLSYLIPRFDDVFTELFYKAIDTNSFILGHLFLNKKIYAKLELLNLNTSYNLIIQFKLLESILNLQNEFSFKILMLCIRDKVFNIFIYLNSKSSAYFNSFLLFLLNNEVFDYSLINNTISRFSPQFKNELLTNYNALKEQLPNYNINYILDNYDSKMIPKLKQNPNFNLRFSNYLINFFDVKNKNIMEEMYNEKLFNENQLEIVKELLHSDDNIYDSESSSITALLEETSMSHPKKIEQLENCMARKLADIDLINCEEMFKNEYLFESKHSEMTRFILIHKIYEPFAVVNFVKKNETYMKEFITFVLNKIDVHSAAISNCNTIIDGVYNENINCIGAHGFKNLGIIIGQLTLKQNLFFTCFDVRKFILKSKKNDILIFVINLIFNSESMVFKLKNPFLKRVLQDICNLNIAVVNAKIYVIYGFVPVQTAYLAHYNLPNNKYDEIISITLDYSVREMIKISKRTLNTVNTTVMHYTNFKNSKNLFINLALNVIDININELLRVCLGNNLNTFFKLANLDYSKININKIINDNLNICKELIKRDCYTRIKNNKNIKEGIKCINLKLMNENKMYDRIEINEIGEKDLDDIKKKLKKLSKTIPNTKFSYVESEFKKIITFVNYLDEIYIENDSELVETDMNNNYVVKFSEIVRVKRNIKALINNLVMFIKSNELYNEMCDNLCKYITAYLIKKKNKILFLFLDELFKISLNSKLDVKYYLIFNKDAKLESLVYEMLKYNYIPLFEYEQFNNDINLITKLILDDEKYFTIYDVLYLLESLLKNQTINFINHMIIDLKYDSSCKFNEVVRVRKYSFYDKTAPFNYIGNVKFDLNRSSNIKGESALDINADLCRLNLNDNIEGGALAGDFNVYTMRTSEISTAEIKLDSNVDDVSYIASCVAISYDHYIKHHRLCSNFKYMKIDCLVDICNNTVYEYLRSLVILAINSENFLFIKFIIRFIYKLNEKFSENADQFICCFRISVIPQFSVLFFYLIDGMVNFEYMLEVIDGVNMNQNLVGLALKYFKSIDLSSTNCLVLNYLVSPHIVELKNLFSENVQKSDFLVVNVDSPVYFVIRKLLFERKSAAHFRHYKGYLTAVVDSLANEYYSELESLVRDGFKVKQIWNLLEMRQSCEGSQRCIANAIEFLKNK